MKKFTFLLSLPLLAVLAIAFLLMVADDSDNFQSRDVVIGIDEHCSEEANYIDCAIDNLTILRTFVDAQNRDPLPDDDYVQNDKGGCDLKILNSFVYKNEQTDKWQRTKYIDYCTNWYAKHAAEILLGENYTNKQAAQLINYNFTQSIDEDRKNKFIEYMSLTGDALASFCREKVKAGVDFGFLRWSECTQPLLVDSPEPSGFSFETKAFSIWAFLLGLAPLLILTGLIYSAFDKWSPILSSATVSWMDSKKQFRIFLVATIAWAAAFLTFSMFEYDTINPFDRDDVWLPVILGLYPLLTYLITYFIVSAEDEDKVEGV
ncbi:hypothetical protein N9507_05725 [Gammaproteobacteria bacterium]|nr:hypothetical protein [Gammaproteobacteria bacterium]